MKSAWRVELQVGKPHDLGTRGRNTESHHMLVIEKSEK